MRIDNEKRLAYLDDVQYKEIFGVSKLTFDAMLAELEKANLN